MKKKAGILVTIVGVTLMLNAGSFQTRVEQLIKDSNYAEESVGVLIKEIKSDKPLVALNHETMYNPASVMKLITGAAALDMLGIQYTFQTKVYIDSTFDSDSGVVPGSVYIRGGGDPGFLAERMWLFIQHLTHCGIKKIAGDLILDDSYFDPEINGPGFGEDNSSRAYEAPIAALSANFNTVAVHVAPANVIGAPVHITPFPRMKGVKIVSTAKTSPAGTSSGLQVKTEIMDGKTAILVFGDMALHEEPRYIFRKVWNTWESFGWICQGLFEECDIAFNGKVRHETVPQSLQSKEPFYTFESQPLPIFVFNMFKYSSNFAAEMVFKTVASEFDSLPGSWRSGARIVSDWWKRKKYLRRKTKTSPIIKNGSGMGGGNRVSPRHIVNLLEYVWYKKTYVPEFTYAMSVAGVDGTLKSRFKHSPLKGIIRAKTGTLNSRGVSNLAGYVLLPEKTCVFAILVTNKKKSQYSHWSLQQKILETVISTPKKRQKRAESTQSDSQPVK